jgi:hypothetical protein
MSYTRIFFIVIISYLAVCNKTVKADGECTCNQQSNNNSSSTASSATTLRTTTNYPNDECFALALINQTYPQFLNNNITLDCTDFETNYTDVYQYCTQFLYSTKLPKHTKVTKSTKVSKKTTDNSDWLFLNNNN